MQLSTKFAFSGKVRRDSPDCSLNQWKHGAVNLDYDDSGHTWVARMFLQVDPKSVWHEMKITPNCEMAVKSERLILKTSNGGAIHIKLNGADVEKAKKSIDNIKKSLSNTPLKGRAEVSSKPESWSCPPVQNFGSENVSPVVSGGHIPNFHDSRKDTSYSASGWLSKSNPPERPGRPKAPPPSKRRLDVMFTDDKNAKSNSGLASSSQKFTGMKDISSRNSESGSFLNTKSFYGSSAQTFRSVTEGFQFNSGTDRSPQVKRKKFNRDTLSMATEKPDGATKELEGSKMSGVQEEDSSDPGIQVEEDRGAENHIGAEHIPVGAATNFSSQQSVGFENLGNSCFMNSPLQCLSSLEPFSLDVQAAILLYGEYFKENSITRILYHLMKDVRKSDICPQRVKEILTQLRHDINGKFAFNTQQDAHELLNELLDRTHEEVKAVAQKVNKTVEMASSSSAFASPDEKESSSSAISPVSLDCSSIQDFTNLFSPVDTNFSWSFTESSKCNVCGHEFPSKTGQDTILILPIDATADYHVQDCVDKYFGDSELERECETCGKTEKALSTKKITHRPRIFILMLLRYQHHAHSQSQKMLNGIVIPRYIGINDFCAEDVKPPPFLRPVFMLDRESDTTVSPKQPKKQNSLQVTFKKAADYIADSLPELQIHSSMDASLPVEGKTPISPPQSTEAGSTESPRIEGAKRGMEETNEVNNKEKKKDGTSPAKAPSKALSKQKVMEQLCSALECLDTTLISWNTAEGGQGEEQEMAALVMSKAKSNLKSKNKSCESIGFGEPLSPGHVNSDYDHLKDGLSSCYKQNYCTLMVLLLMKDLLDTDNSSGDNGETDHMYIEIALDIIKVRYMDIDADCQMNRLISDLALCQALGEVSPRKKCRFKENASENSSEVQSNKPKQAVGLNEHGYTKSKTHQSNVEDKGYDPFFTSTLDIEQPMPDFTRGIAGMPLDAQDDFGYPPVGIGGLNNYINNNDFNSGFYNNNLNNNNINNANNHDFGLTRDSVTAILGDGYSISNVSGGGLGGLTIEPPRPSPSAYLSSSPCDPLRLGKELCLYTHKELSLVNAEILTEDEQIQLAMAFSLVSQGSDPPTVESQCDVANTSMENNPDDTLMDDADDMELCLEADQAEIDIGVSDPPTDESRSKEGLSESNSKTTEEISKEDRGDAKDGLCTGLLTPMSSRSSEEAPSGNSVGKAELMGIDNLGCDEVDFDEGIDNILDDDLCDSARTLGLGKGLDISPDHWPKTCHKCRTALLDGHCPWCGGDRLEARADWPGNATKHSPKSGLSPNSNGQAFNHSPPNSHSSPKSNTSPNSVFKKPVLMDKKNTSENNTACKALTVDIPPNSPINFPVNGRLMEKDHEKSPEVKFAVSDHVVPSLIGSAVSPRKDMYLMSPSKTNILVKTKDYSRLRSPSPKKKPKVSTPTAHASRKLLPEIEKSASKKPSRSGSGQSREDDQGGERNSEVSSNASSVEVNVDETSNMNQKLDEVMAICSESSDQQGQDIMSSSQKSSIPLVATVSPIPKYTSIGTTSKPRLSSSNLSTNPFAPVLSKPMPPICESAPTTSPVDSTAQNKKTHKVSVLSSDLAQGNTKSVGPIQPPSAKSKATRCLSDSFTSTEEKENKTATAETLSRNKRWDEIERRQVPSTYKLMGVVNHLGDSLNGGHYISYCFNLRKQRWFHMDDKYTSETTETDARKDSLTTGYVFFYMDSELFDQYEEKAKEK